MPVHTWAVLGEQVILDIRLSDDTVGAVGGEVWLRHFGPPLGGALTRALSRGGPHLKISRIPHYWAKLVSVRVTLVISPSFQGDPSGVGGEPASLPRARIVDALVSVDGVQHINDRDIEAAEVELGEALPALILAIYDCVKNTGWFDPSELHKLANTLTPQYTLGTDASYRSHLQTQSVEKMEATRPKLVLTDGWFVTSATQAVVNHPVNKAYHKDILIPTLYDRGAHFTRGMVALEVTSILALLGLFKQRAGEGSDPHVNMFDGKTASPELHSQQVDRGARSVGVQLASWVRASADVGNDVIPDLPGMGALTGMPGEVWQWLTKTQPALSSFLLLDRTPHLDKQMSTRELRDLTAPVKLSIPGVVIRLRSIRDKFDESKFTTAWVVRLRAHKQRKYLKALNRLFPPVSAVDSIHQTTHLADWVWSYIHWKPRHGASWEGSRHRTPSQRLRQVNGLLQWIPIGTAQPMALGFLMAGLTHSEGEVIRQVYLESGLLFTDTVQQSARCKEVGTQVRKCGWLPEIGELTAAQVRSLAYYDLLSGRLPNRTNWEDEYNNRCKHTIHIQRPKLKFDLRVHEDVTIKWMGVETTLHKGMLRWSQDDENLDPSRMRRSELFYTDLWDELLEICNPLVTSKNTREPLERFIKRRHEWMASGSSAGAKVAVTDAMKSVVKEDVLKVSKRAWGEHLTYSQVRAALFDQPPVECAHASEKYENGKARAIYGVEPMHYVINTYATKGFEEKLHLIEGLEKGASGAEQARFEAIRAHITSDSTMECSMLDYADFNRHHTPEAQALIFEVFAYLGELRGARREWIHANRWVAKAKRNMQVIFPDSTKPVRVVQGMFSGTRSTDLINTLLNLAYFRIAQKYLSESVGLEPVKLYNVHQGDDVWISNKNVVWARALYYALNSMGFLFQESKQMFGAGRGEYLRVLYIEGGGGGYFARALANYITRPLQQDAPLDPVGWLRTIREGCALLSRRGMGTQGVQCTYSNGVSFWARARAHTRDMAPVSLPEVVINAPGYVNGLGCSLPHTATPYDLGEVPPTLPKHPTFTSEINVAGTGMPTHMSDDWIEFVSERTRSSRLPVAFDSKSIKDAMVNTNYSTDLTKLVKDRGWATLKHKWAKYRDSVRGCRLPYSNKDLRFVKGWRDAIDKISPASCGDPGCSGTIHLPLWEQHLAHISQPEGEAIKDISRLSSVLQNIINKSKFKSETTMARAYGLTRLEAVSVILAEADDLGYGNQEVSDIVSAIWATNNNDLLEWMLGEKGDISSCVSDWVNIPTWRYAQTQFLNSTLQWVPNNATATSGMLMHALRTAWQSWLGGLLKDSSAITGVVY